MSTQRLKRADRILAPEVAFLMSTNISGVRCIEVHHILTIGRHKSNHLEIADPFVSTYHARIEKRSEGFLIRDLKSRNGTFVNGTKVSEAPLYPGDRITIGEREFAFEFQSVQVSRDNAPQTKNFEWAQTLKSVPVFAKTDLPVLLLGESGTGKEVIARTIHGFSQRTKGPFVSVNCSALGESLVESELFGHLKGSFTGASHDRKGAFESARGGTLFLDEIGDLPLDLQPKLLRALENKEIRPVGGDKTVPTDTRIIAATHRNLKQLIEKGKFRNDLYFRLNVVKIVLPRLTDRLEDFEDLLIGFAREMRVRFTPMAILELKRHSWPGNIRELRNIVARASALYQNQEIDMPQVKKLIDQVHPNETTHAASTEPELQELGKPNTLNGIREMERQIIIEKLIANNGNQRRTAKDLGMPKSTLHDRIKSYKINIEQLLLDRPFATTRTTPVTNTIAPA